jgi:hypothetical protein
MHEYLSRAVEHYGQVENALSFSHTFVGEGDNLWHF